MLKENIIDFTIHVRKLSFKESYKVILARNPSVIVNCCFFFFSCNYDKAVDSHITKHEIL